MKKEKYSVNSRQNERLDIIRFGDFGSYIVDITEKYLLGIGISPYKNTPLGYWFPHPIFDMILA